MNRISSYAIIDRKCDIGKGVVIGEYCVIGKKVAYLKKRLRIKIKNDCRIGSHVVIYEGVTLGKDTQVEDFCRIGENTNVGNKCRIIYGAKIYGHIQIGDRCIIGGFICEDVIIGKCCRIFGELVHSHKIRTSKFENIRKWDKGGEKSPKIGSNVFIGFGAKIIGGITIGNNCYILPGSIVTKNVPKNTKVKGVNVFEPNELL